MNVNLNNLDDYQEKSYSKDKHIMSLEIMCQECKWKFDQILIVGRLKEIIYVPKSLSKRSQTKPCFVTILDKLLEWTH